jgi:hypothetical protein
MRTLEEYSVVLPPVACADIATMAGQALIVCPDDDCEIMVRDYLFTPFGLTATVRFDPNGAIADKKLSAGSWHDLLNAAIETLARRAGIDQEDEEDWPRMALLLSEWQTVLDDATIIADLAAERIFVIPGLEGRQELLGSILDGTVTMDEARAAAVNPVDFENDQALRRSGVVLDDTWSQDENEIDEAIANATLEDEVVLFGILDDQDQFLHTIGLSEYAWPEIVVRNLDPHLSPFLLRTIVAMHEMAGVVPTAGRIPDEIMPGGLRLRAVDRAVAHETFPRADGGTGILEVVFPL